MSTGPKVGRPLRRRHVIGATTIVAVVVSLLTLGSASARLVSQRSSGDALAARNAMSSTHSLSRAHRHASLASHASRHAARHSLSSSNSIFGSLLPGFANTTTEAISSLAPVNCGSATTPIATASGFEDADGNLDPTASCMDWNGFTPTWSGSPATTPPQTGTATNNGFSFVGATDLFNSTSDNIYAGGVKQDTVCPGTVTGKANDKADLAAIYIAAKQINGQTYLFLAWERQLDTTVNSDVFVSFEFNQSKVSCGAGSPFVQRTGGDLLIEYNFQSGNSTIDVQQWNATTKTWNPLPTPPFEASVNAGTVSDTIRPDKNVSLTTFEFGEAGLDLSALDLTGNGGKACETFGGVLGGSRTSKSGDNAQLKDFVGPAPLDVSNCVSPTVTTALKKHADNSSITNGSSIPFGSTVHDTATLGNLVSGTPTGKVQYTFFTNINCSGAGTSAGLKTLNADGTVPNSDPEGPLAAGAYSFEAQCLSGNDPNYSDSEVSGCEPFHVIASPSIGTTQTPSSGGLAASLSDSATLSGTSNLLGTGSVTFYLYAPGATCHNDGSGTTVYSHVASSTVSTNGPFASGSFAGPLLAGTYQWVAVFSGDANNSSASSGCGNEPVVITASPSITTTQSETTGGLADSLSDSATLHSTSNLLGTGSVTFYLYAPGATCHNDGSGTTVYSHVASSTVSTNGPFASGSFAGPLAAGTYQWVAVFSGDANNSSASSGCGNEPVVITASPSITTTQSETTGGLADSLSDSATLHSTSNLLGTGSVTFYLYAPGATCHNDGSGTTVYSHVASSTVSTNGPFASGSFAGPLVAGTYQWVAVFSGDANNSSASSGCGNEPVVITASPSITTTQSETTGGLADSLSDSATLHSTSNLLGTGTVTFYLFAPGVACNTAGTGNVYTHTVTGISTNGPHASGSFAGPLVAGTYHWLAVFSGDTNTPGPVDSGCASEPVVITASPTVTTDQTPKSGSVGDTLNDSATLHNTSNLLGTGSVTIFLFEPGVACDTSGTGAADSWTFSSVSDNGPFDTSTTNKGGFVSDQPGVYHFVAVFSGDTNNPGPVDSGCASEPVVINPADVKVLKMADASSVNAGDPVGFTITVWNSGAGDAAGVKLNDTLPTNAGLNWTIDSQGAGWNGSCAIAAGVLTCGGANGVTVPHNTTQAASTFTVHIVSPTTKDTAGACPGSGVVDNTGHVTTTNDGNPSSEDTVCVNPADVKVLKMADASSVNAGDPVGFTITVWNSGAGDAAGVKLNDTLPTNAGLNWTIDSQGAGWNGSCAIAAGVLTCGGANGVTVPHNTTQAASTFTVHIVSPTTKDTAGACPGSGVVDNTGNVTSTNDGNPSSEDTVCVNPASIKIVKTADASSVSAGDPVGFTITVWNSGAGDAAGVKLNDTLPVNAGLSWTIAAQGAGWNGSCAIAAGVLHCGGGNGVTVPHNTTHAASTFTGHIASPPTKDTAGACPGSGVVDNTGNVTTTNDGNPSSEDTVCVNPAAVQVLKTADASSVNAGDPVGFTI